MSTVSCETITRQPNYF